MLAASNAHPSAAVCKTFNMEIFTLNIEIKKKTPCLTNKNADADTDTAT